MVLTNPGISDQDQRVVVASDQIIVIELFLPTVFRAGLLEPRRMALRWLCRRAYLLSEGKYGGTVLSCNSVGLNEMVPVAVGGGVGGDNRWAAGPRNEFRSGYSGRGSSGWNNNRVSQTLKTHTSSAAPKGTSSDVRGTSSSCGKHKPQPQLDSYGFQMQRASDARNFDMSALQHVTLENPESLEIVSGVGHSVAATRSFGTDFQRHVHCLLSSDNSISNHSHGSIGHIKLLLMGSLSTKEAALSTPFLLAPPVMNIGFHLYSKDILKD
ncbi:hypothetical protein Tco_0940108 [Tanacetum coccineum]|uniref:Uncharacterized protein n=1 Tax=Tanacetum coccineum TaxID=301880 RepID=A0ABQ5DPL5_9ASTR